MGSQARRTDMWFPQLGQSDANADEPLDNKQQTKAHGSGSLSATCSDSGCTHFNDVGEFVDSTPPESISSCAETLPNDICIEVSKYFCDDYCEYIGQDVAHLLRGSVTYRDRVRSTSPGKRRSLKYRDFGFRGFRHAARARSAPRSRTRQSNVPWVKRTYYDQATAFGEDFRVSLFASSQGPPMKLYNHAPNSLGYLNSELFQSSFGGELQANSHWLGTCMECSGPLNILYMHMREKIYDCHVCAGSFYCAECCLTFCAELPMQADTQASDRCFELLEACELPTQDEYEFDAVCNHCGCGVQTDCVWECEFCLRHIDEEASKSHQSKFLTLGSQCD